MDAHLGDQVIASEVVGVVGAGTMGAGIAQVALAAGHQVILVDPLDAQRAKAREAIAAGLTKLAAKDKLPEGVGAALARLRDASAIAGLAAATIVIEAAPEDLALKRRILGEAAGVCGPGTVLASNTSSLSLTAIAGAIADPGRVVGLHFFNPAPLMALVEVVRADRTDPAIVERMVAFAKDLGKTPVITGDTPGFIVNRVARPFYGEGLRLMGDHGLAPAALDAAMTGVAGFKMGPCALMDLIGLDVNLAVTRAVYEMTFHETRYRPHGLQQRRVDAGALGRKSGFGFYRYDGEGPAAYQPPTPSGKPPAHVVLVGDGPHLAAWSAAWATAGIAVTVVETSTGVLPAGLWPDCSDVDLAMEVGEGIGDDRVSRRSRLGVALPAGVWLVSDDVTCTATGLAAGLGRPVAIVSGWSNPATATALELALPEGNGAIARLAGFLAPLGKTLVPVPDVPGLASARTLAMLVNEAAFAVEEGVASPADIDRAMTLGVNYPRGPLAWGDAIGPIRVLALLERLRVELGDRYRPAPWLRRRAIAGLPLASR